MGSSKKARGSKIESKHKAAKRKREETVRDLPDEGEPSENIEAQTANGLENGAPRKRAKRSKRFTEEIDSGAGVIEEQDGIKSVSVNGQQLRDKRSTAKRAKKAKSKETTRVDVKDKSQRPVREASDIVASDEQLKDDGITQEQEERVSKNHRFIVFVGNLPFNATTGSIQTHFASVNPTSIRHRTHKDEPSKSKGFAFLEFDGYARMETCLKKFHHSRFEDGVGGHRKINVELTAGGGGKKSRQRNLKLKTKNQKLNEERKGRVEKEEKVNGEKTRGDVGMVDVHPSRRSRVPTE